MGKHIFYLNHSNRGRFESSRNTPDRFSMGEYTPGRRSRKRNKKDRREAPVSGDKILSARINQLLERFKSDPDKISEIGAKVEMFELNRTIARDMGDAEAEKRLTESLISYLNSI